MRWQGEYVVNERGMVMWAEGFEITDPCLVQVARVQPGMFTTLWALGEMGVQVGCA